MADQEPVHYGHKPVTVLDGKGVVAFLRAARDEATLAQTLEDLREDLAVAEKLATEHAQERHGGAHWTAHPCSQSMMLVAHTSYVADCVRVMAFASQP